MERSTAIREAAGRLLDGEGLEGTGLNAIAREAGISKANIYRYFESREAVLLDLLQDEVRAWGLDLAARIKRLEGGGDPDTIAGAFTASIMSRPRFCTLVAAMSSVLEHRVGRDAIRAFKRGFLQSVSPPVEALHAEAPWLTHDQAFQGLGSLVTMSVGLWPHANPPVAVAEVLKEPEFAALRLDFESTLRMQAVFLLRGMRASS